MDTCRTCRQAADRTLGSVSYCQVHLDAVLDEIRDRVLNPESWDGVGRRRGVIRPDHGPGRWDLRCDQCAATWVGVPGELCAWCHRERRLAEAHQAELDLTPPQHRDEAALIAWGQRLKRAVEAGRVTDRQARNAWDKVRRGAA